MRNYYVYILASNSRCLYVGTTNDLARRATQHRAGSGCEFTRKYRVARLVYYEQAPSALAMMARERQLKRWTRARKHRLIESINAGWLDLSADWCQS